MKFKSFTYLLAIFCFTGGILGQSIAASQKVKEKVPEADQAALNENKVSLVKGRVKAVYDGDTLGIEGKDKKIYSIRLQGVDAPENGQNYGKAARENLALLVRDKVVVVIVHDKDKLDRYIGSIYLNGMDIGLRQVEAGMAWHFKKYSYEQTADDRKRYAQAEQKARTDRLGLWEDKAPVPPWEFRGDDTADVRAVAPATLTGTPTGETKNAEPAVKPGSSPTRTYIIGPRGGCYYVNDSGSKVYVKDKSVCGKPSVEQ